MLDYFKSMNTLSDLLELVEDYYLQVTSGLQWSGHQDL